MESVQPRAASAHGDSISFRKSRRMKMDVASSPVSFALSHHTINSLCLCLPIARIFIYTFIVRTHWHIRSSIWHLLFYNAICHVSLLLRHKKKVRRKRWNISNTQHTNRIVLSGFDLKGKKYTWVCVNRFCGCHIEDNKCTLARKSGVCVFVCLIVIESSSFADMIGYLLFT